MCSLFGSTLTQGYPIKTLPESIFYRHPFSRRHYVNDELYNVTSAINICLRPEGEHWCNVKIRNILYAEAIQQSSFSNLTSWLALCSAAHPVMASSNNVSQMTDEEIVRAIRSGTMVMTNARASTQRMNERRQKRKIRGLTLASQRKARSGEKNAEERAQHG